MRVFLSEVGSSHFYSRINIENVLHIIVFIETAVLSRKSSERGYNFLNVIGSMGTTLTLQVRYEPLTFFQR